MSIYGYGTPSGLEEHQLSLIERNSPASGSGENDEIDEHEQLQLLDNLVVNTQSSVINEIIHELEKGTALNGSKAHVTCTLAFCIPAFVAKGDLCYVTSKNAN